MRPTAGSARANLTSWSNVKRRRGWRAACLLAASDVWQRAKVRIDPHVRRAAGAQVQGRLHMQRPHVSLASAEGLGFRSTRAPCELDSSPVVSIGTAGPWRQTLVDQHCGTRSPSCRAQEGLVQEVRGALNKIGPTGTT